MSALTFFILCLEGAVLSFNVAATAALVPSIAKDFALSQFFVGKIIWLYMVPYGIAALVYGPLIRAIDAKRVELACMFMFSAANLLAALATSIYALFFARFLMGFFGASVIPLGLILIARHIEGSQRGKFVGIFFSATFIASLLGLFLSGILSWRWIYFIPSVCGFATFILIYLFLPSFKKDTCSFRINYLQAFKNKNIISVFTYIFFISLLYHGIQQWLSVYFSSSFNFGQFVISMLITLTSLSGVFGEALGGWFADSLGRLRIVNLGIVLMILTAILIIFKLSPITLAILMIIWGLGWTFNHAGVSTILTDLPEEFLNEAASLNSSVRFLSGGLGVLVSGVIMQKSFSAGFLTLGAGLILLLIFSKELLGTPLKPIEGHPWNQSEGCPHGYNCKFCINMEGHP